MVGWFSFQENRWVRYLLNRRSYNKGDPGDRLGAGLKKDGNPNPRGRSPFFIWAGLGGSVRVDFHKKKIGQQSGGWEPRRRFCPFCRYELKLGQKEVAAQSMSFLEGLRSLCADIPQQKSGLRATFFLHTKKEGKDVPRGVPLEPRMVLIFRAIVGHHNGG